ncbi:hypothetical protein [Pseudonocardia spinosispora]|uniref:Rv3212 family protein n=1 Tax=Pseudonocardia spinosispora TaxID=103441 RepID=UPI0003FCD4B4|nr:hypothetical protein [Pseudonocardia spinosispora]
MLRAERRRRGDLVAAAVLVAVVLLGAGLIALLAPVSHTTSITAVPPLQAPADPPAVPAALTEAWRAPSAATSGPVAVGPAVVTGDGESVIGRDPLTGAERWSYRRDLPLCTVGSAWNMALAVFRNGEYCSEVTALQPDTGARGPQRNSDVRPDTRLLDDGYLVTATGSDHLETWRSDLVKTQEYGALRADLQPDTQPRPQCRHTSVAVTSGRVAVVERCPKEPGDRLTVLHPDGDESEKPVQEFSTVLQSAGTRVVAVTSSDSGAREAILMPNPPRLSIRGAGGAETAVYPLALPPEDLAGDPPGEVVPTFSVPGAVLWWTGSSTIALDSTDLHPLWTLPGALGPGTVMAGTPLIPVPNAQLVVNPATGAVVRAIPVDRGAYQGPVSTAALGPILLEQRGPTLVALH